MVAARPNRMVIREHGEHGTWKHKIRMFGGKIGSLRSIACHRIITGTKNIRIGQGCSEFRNQIVISPLIKLAQIKKRNHLHHLHRQLIYSKFASVISVSQTFHVSSQQVDMDYSYLVRRITSVNKTRAPDLNAHAKRSTNPHSSKTAIVQILFFFIIHFTIHRFAATH